MEHTIKGPSHSLEAKYENGARDPRVAHRNHIQFSMIGRTSAGFNEW